PDTKLHVQETINTNYTSAAAAIDANNLFKIENDSDTPDHPFAGMHLRANLTDMFIGVKEESDNLGDLYIVHEGDELVRIVGEGHVGIGTTNPTKHADTNNTAILNVGIVTANTVFAGNVKLDGGNTTIGDDIDTRNLNVSGVSTFIGVSTFAGGVGIADTLYHLGDQDTRIRFPSADTFTIETGGAEEFRVTGAGVSIAGISTVVGFATFFDQVFIGGDNSLVVAGFSTFSNNLDINADIDVDGHTELDNVSVAGFATFTSHVVDIDSDLDVDGHTNLDNVDIAGITTISVSSASTALRITQTGAGDALRVEDSANPDSSPFIITNAGNAGIGTAVPNSKLHVSGGAANGAISITNDTVGNTFTDGLTLISQTGGNAFIAQRENASLTFSTNNTDRVTISSGGDVGIGTTNPSAPANSANTSV
ncbi:MAG: hypothetical protein VW312_04020, partial [Opitutales bacterium]